jgi:hypothetical protein
MSKPLGQHKDDCYNSTYANLAALCATGQSRDQKQKIKQNTENQKEIVFIRTTECIFSQPNLGGRSMWLHMIWERN